MLTQFFKFMLDAFGLGAFSHTALFFMTIRGIIVYLFGITLTRFNKKLFGIRTPFNFILFIMLGSIFANAILYADTFIHTLGTVLILMLLNGLITVLSYYVPVIELFVKGSPSQLVKNGEIQWDEMRKEFITQRELLTELHSKLHTHDLNKIAAANLESDGTIEFIEKREVK